jgi:hypothetical protein
MQMSENYKAVQPRLKKVVFFSVILLALFLARTFNTDFYEVYDSHEKWVYINQLQSGYYRIPKDNYQTHHFMRWAVNLPSALGMWLAGFSLKVYYFFPILFFSIFLILFVRKSSRSMAWPWVLLLGVFIYIDPMMTRMSTQLHTRIYGSLYILLCILCLDLKNPRWRMISCAALLFCAYGAKATYGIFFGPVIGLYILLKYPLRDQIVFSSTLMVLFAIETLLINQTMPGLQYGRMQALLEGSHLNRTMFTFRNLDLVKMAYYPWRDFSTFHIYLAIISVGYALIRLLIPRYRKTLSRFEFLILACLISYFFWMIFSFNQFDPFIPLQPPRTIYYAVVFPFMYFSAFLAFQHLCTFFCQRCPNLPVARYVNLLCLFLSAALLSAFLLQIDPFRLDPRHKQARMYQIYFGTAFWTADRQLQQTAEALRQGVTFVKYEPRTNIRIHALVYNLMQASPEFANKANYKWHKINGVNVFSTTGMAIEDRATCLYLAEPEFWVLVWPNQQDYKECIFEPWEKRESRNIDD